MMGFGGMGGGMWLLWVALAAGAYFLFYGGLWPREGGRRGALRIAEERYARGEITAEELDEIRDNLESY
jgi:uncharacterized membrane protein